MLSADARIADTYIHLTVSGVSVVLDITRGRLPAITHWGAALGPQTLADLRTLSRANIEPLSGNVVDQPIRLALLPEHWTGWVGKPGLSGGRHGRAWSPKFTVTTITVDGKRMSDSRHEQLLTLGAASVEFGVVDRESGLHLSIYVELKPGGLLRSRATLTNLGDELYSLQDLAFAFPIPPRAREILDFAGRWGKERVPQRGDLRVGIHEREGRKGRTGLEAATVLSVGVPGFGFARGEVWGVHVGFSGNHRHYAERLFNGFQVIGGGELLLPGEVELSAGQSYTTPWVYAAYGDGLDSQAARFHDYLRSRPRHPHSNRPVTLNVWEAVFFRHDLEQLRDLATRAAGLGVERYVLDDGWMRGRHNDSAGLGDWFVDEEVWPKGLHPLVDHVRQLGMEFGLWFEPEMITLASDTAREHPDWILGTGDRTPVSARHQQVLNLTNTSAYDSVLGRMIAIIEEYDLTYLKWDHNRDLIDAGSAPTGHPAVHEQTLAAYRLMDSLRQRFPRLEIESCSSGGGRVDLGILEHTDRVWVSDCIDPLERQQMNRWTMQLVPPELIGSHVGSNPNHSTDRVHRLSFRAGTALFGHFGIEWDLAAASESDREDLASWVDLYKQIRHIIQTGTLIRADETDSTLWFYGALTKDQRDGIFFLAYFGRSEVSPRGRFTIPGLAPDVRYRVRPIIIGQPSRGVWPPVWFGIHRDTEPQRFAVNEDDAYLHYIRRGQHLPGVVMTGKALASAGLQAPASMPDEVIVLRVTAEDDAE